MLMLHNGVAEEVGQEARQDVNELCTASKLDWRYLKLTVNLGSSLTGYKLSLVEKLF